MVVPPVHVADNLQLGPRTYTILVKGVEVARGELCPTGCWPSTPAPPPPASRAPRHASRRSACRRSGCGRAARRATAAGYTVVDPTTALSTHLSEIIRTFLPDLLTRQHTKELVDRVAQTSPKLVEELVPKLLGRRRPARAAAAAARARAGPRPDDHSRGRGRRAGDQGPGPGGRGRPAALGRSICRHHQTEKGDLPAISLAPSLEERLVPSVVRTDHGAVLAIDPNEAQRLARASRAPSNGSGTTCAFVHADVASSPVAAVLTGPAADGRAVAQRSARAREGRPGSRTRLTP